MSSSSRWTKKCRDRTKRVWKEIRKWFREHSFTGRGFLRALLLVVMVGIVLYNWNHPAKDEVRIAAFVALVFVAVWLFRWIGTAQKPKMAIFAILFSALECALLYLLYPGAVQWPRFPVVLYVVCVTSAILSWFLCCYFPVIIGRERRKRWLQSVTAVVVQVMVVLAIIVIYKAFYSWIELGGEVSDDGVKMTITVSASIGSLAAGIFATMSTLNKEPVYGISHNSLLRNVTLWVRGILIFTPILMVMMLVLHGLRELGNDAIVVLSFFERILPDMNIFVGTPLYSPFPPIFFSLVATNFLAIITAAFFPLLLSSGYVEDRANFRLQSALGKDQKQGTRRWQRYMDISVSFAARGETQTLAFVAKQIAIWGEQVCAEWWEQPKKEKKGREAKASQAASVLLWISRLLVKGNSYFEAKQVFLTVMNALKERWDNAPWEEQRIPLATLVLVYPLWYMGDPESSKAMKVTEASLQERAFLDAVRDCGWKWSQRAMFLEMTIRVYNSSDDPAQYNLPEDSKTRFDLAGALQEELIMKECASLGESAERYLERKRPEWDAAWMNYQQLLKDYYVERRVRDPEGLAASDTSNQTTDTVTL